MTHLRAPAARRRYRRSGRRQLVLPGLEATERIASGFGPVADVGSSRTEHTFVSGDGSGAAWDFLGHVPPGAELLVDTARRDTVAAIIDGYQATSVHPALWARIAPTVRALAHLVGLTSTTSARTDLTGLAQYVAQLVVEGHWIPEAGGWPPFDRDLTETHVMLHVDGTPKTKTRRRTALRRVSQVLHPDQWDDGPVPYVASGVLPGYTSTEVGMMEIHVRAMWDATGNPAPAAVFAVGRGAGLHAPDYRYTWACHVHVHDGVPVVDVGPPSPRRVPLHRDWADLALDAAAALDGRLLTGGSTPPATTSCPRPSSGSTRAAPCGCTPPGCATPGCSSLLDDGVPVDVIAKAAGISHLHTIERLLDRIAPRPADRPSPGSPGRAMTHLRRHRKITRRRVPTCGSRSAAPCARPAGDRSSTAPSPPRPARPTRCPPPRCSPPSPTSATARSPTPTSPRSRPPPHAPHLDRPARRARPCRRGRRTRRLRPGLDARDLLRPDRRKFHWCHASSRRSPSSTARWTGSSPTCCGPPSPTTPSACGTSSSTAPTSSVGRQPSPRDLSPTRTPTGTGSSQGTTSDPKLGYLMVAAVLYDPTDEITTPYIAGIALAPATPPNPEGSQAARTDRTPHARARPRRSPTAASPASPDVYAAAQQRHGDLIQKPHRETSRT
jgi:hypothetical protein